MKFIILILSLLLTFSINAQVSPDIISASINKESFKIGEEAVLTVFKVAGPQNPNIALSVEANLTTPDSNVTPVDLNLIASDVYMSLSAPLNLNGQHVFIIKAFIEDQRISSSLRTLIVDLKKKICDLEVEIELENDPALREILLREKSKLEIDLLIANTHVNENRLLVQEKTIAFKVTDNGTPIAQLFGSDIITADTLFIDAKYSTRFVCVNGSVLDPEDEGDYLWEIDFGDGNQIKFNNLSNPNSGNAGCVIHSFFGNQRPLITYKATDKDGNSLVLSGTLDIRTDTHRPLPNLKVSNLQKIMIPDSSGNEVPALEVTFDPLNTRIPSNSGIQHYHLSAQGPCQNTGPCPYDDGGPLRKMVFRFSESGSYTLQYYVRDNFLNARIAESKLELDLTSVPQEPTKEFRDELFGPSAIIQVNRSSVKISDTSLGAEVKFDGSASFDISGDDTKLKYYWDFGDGFSGSNYSYSQKSTHFYKKPGTYYATFYVVDEHGNRSENDYLHITVQNKNVEDIPPTFMAYRTGETQQVMFSILNYRMIVPTPSDQYYWDFGDGTGEVTNSGAPVKTYSEPGIYEVEVTYQDMTGKFVTAKKIIDTTNNNPVPQLSEGIRVTPWDFVNINETAIFDASIPDVNSLNYFWWLPNGGFFSGGMEEATQSLVFKEKGINHIRLDIINESGFSSESSAFLASGERKIEISNISVAEVDGNTKVDFTVTAPTDPLEMKRIEIFNFNSGWSIVENPESMNISQMINGAFDPVVIVLTDFEDNQNIFIQGFNLPLPGTRERNFPISDVLMNSIEKSNQYVEFLKKLKL